MYFKKIKINIFIFFKNLLTTLKIKCFFNNDNKPLLAGQLDRQILVWLLLSLALTPFSDKLRQDMSVGFKDAAGIQELVGLKKRFVIQCIQEEELFPIVQLPISQVGSQNLQ